MKLHPTIFQFLKPSDAQIETMAHVRLGFADLVKKLDFYLPDGPDKTYIVRQLRTCAMWANVAITREADGAPREPEEMTDAENLG